MKIIVLVISNVTKIVYVTIRTHFENRLVDPNWNEQLYLFIYNLKQKQDFLLIDQKEINHPRARAPALTRPDPGLECPRLTSDPGPGSQQPRNSSPILTWPQPRHLPLTPCPGPLSRALSRCQSVCRSHISLETVLRSSSSSASVTSPRFHKHGVIHWEKLVKLK